jgi:gas vesicle protein
MLAKGVSSDSARAAFWDMMGTIVSLVDEWHEKLEKANEKLEKAAKKLKKVEKKLEKTDVKLE